MTEPESINIPEPIWQRIVALHERTCGNMGPLHIVLEDGNLDDQDIEYAVQHAVLDGARIDDEVERLDYDEACVIGSYMKRLTPDHRLYRAVRAIHRPADANVSISDYDRGVDISVDPAADGEESHWATLQLLPDGRWIALNDCCDGACKRQSIKRADQRAGRQSYEADIAMIDIDIPDRTPEPSALQIERIQRIYKPRRNGMLQVLEAFAAYLRSTQNYREQPSPSVAATVDWQEEL